MNGPLAETVSISKEENQSSEHRILGSIEYGVLVSPNHFGFNRFNTKL